MGPIVLSGMDFGAKRREEKRGKKKKRKTRTPPPLVRPLFPFTNHTRSNSVTPPADLNSDAAGANGMRVVWVFFFQDEDSGSGGGREVGGMRPLHCTAVNTDSNPLWGPTTCM